MDGTTSIEQLPSDNVYDPNNSQNQNIKMETMPINQEQQPMQQQPMQQQPIQQQQQPMQQQQQPMQQQQQHPNNAMPISRPMSPQLNQTINNDPSLMTHLSGIQQMNLMNNGSMDLPSRDIPMNTNNITQDQQIQPNYVPTGTHFINNQVSQDMINDYGKVQNNLANNYDFVYDQFKIPFIITIIFYLFNQAFVNSTLLAYFPGLFNNEYNLKKIGMAFKSLLFGLTYYGLDKLIDHFSKI